MDTFQMTGRLRRLWWASVALAVGMLLAPVVVADITPTTGYRYWTGTQFSSVASTPAELCAAPYWHNPDLGPDGAGPVYCGPEEFYQASPNYGYGYCWTTVYAPNNPQCNGQGYPIQQSPPQCPSNSTLVGEVCVCNTGYTESGGQCVSACKQGEKTVESMFMGWDPGRVGWTTVETPYRASYPNSNACVGGCVAGGSAATNAVVDCYSYLAQPTRMYCEIEMEKSGQACSGTEDAQPTPLTTADPCPPGMSIGVINGVQRCFGGAGSQTATTTESTVTHEGGATTTTRITTNPDGSTTTRVTDRDANGNVTGETVTTSGGTGTGTGASGGSDQAQFCRDNPNSPMCKPSAFAGSCEASFMCDGDAIQCAQAQAAWALQCELTKESDVATLGNAILSGADPQAGSLPSRDNPSVVELGSITSVSSAWGTTCPDDVTVELLGNEITLPLSELCWLLELLGLINVTLTAFACARIIGIWG